MIEFRKDLYFKNLIPLKNINSKWNTKDYISIRANIL